MNLRSIPFTHTSFKAAILLAVYLCALFAARSAWAANEPLIATAVTIDLIFSIPLAYLFCIRNTSIPKLTVIPVFFVGVGTAYIVLPAGERTLPVGVFGYLGYRVYRTRAVHKAEAQKGRDVMKRLRSAMEKEIRPQAIGRIAAFELALFYHVFLAWLRRSFGRSTRPLNRRSR